MEGVGIDIIEIDRIARAVENPRFVRRVYTEREIAYCRRFRGAARFAGRWAAKEAVMKALGRTFPWRTIEIVPQPGGAPRVVLAGAAAAALGDRRVIVSISHCNGYAVAQAVVLPAAGAPPSPRESPPG